MVRFLFLMKMELIQWFGQMQSRESKTFILKH